MDIADAGADGVGHVVFPFHFHESHRIGARVLRGFLDCGPGLAEEKILMVRIHTVAGCADENRGCTDLKEVHVEMHGCVNAQSVWFSRN